MRRRVLGVGDASQKEAVVEDGVYLAEVRGVQYERNRQKPFYVVRFAILEPGHSAGRAIAGRLYCTPKAVWKLAWFLRDFGYSPDELDRDEIDEKAIVGLRGVIKISHTVVNGHALMNLDAFAPAAAWDGIAPSSSGRKKAAS